MHHLVLYSCFAAGFEVVQILPPVPLPHKWFQEEKSGSLTVSTEQFQCFSDNSMLRNLIRQIVVLVSDYDFLWQQAPHFNYKQYKIDFDPLFSPSNDVTENILAFVLVDKESRTSC